MKTLKVVEPYRPHLVLRHVSGLTYRYKSWSALWNCRDLNPYYYRVRYLDHGDFRKPDHVEVFCHLRDDWYWRHAGPVLVDFSLRWDDGEPVSSGDKLFDERAYRKRRRKRAIRAANRLKKRGRVSWKNVSRVKRHLHYVMGVCPEEGEPPIRKKAMGEIRPSGYCDYDDDYRLIQKSWKYQSKRKNQWRPKDA